jgi:hypothetical protein
MRKTTVAKAVDQVTNDAASKTPPTAQEMTTQALLDELCGQRNEAQNKNAQLGAELRMVAAERDGYKQAALALAEAIQKNDHAKVPEILEALGLKK